MIIDPLEVLRGECHATVEDVCRAWMAEREAAKVCTATEECPECGAPCEASHRVFESGDELHDYRYVAPMLASAQPPIPMILHCPSCHFQHIDAPEPKFADNGADNTEWHNPPHRSHLCHNCGTVWRPADVPTVGAEKIQTQGKNDVMMPAPLASALVPDGWSITPEKNPLGGPQAMRLHAPDGRTALFGSFSEEVLTREFLAMLAAAPKRGEG